MQAAATASEGAEARRAELRARLTELGQQFRDNVASATRDFAYHATDEAELAGLSPQELERARRLAERAGVEGFLLTLDAHGTSRALASLHDRALRKTLYEAYCTRASDRGPCAGRFDNTPLVSEILELRHELARLSGSASYGAFAVSEGWVSDPDQAEQLLLTLHRDTRARAQTELDALWAFAKEKGVPRAFPTGICLTTPPGARATSWDTRPPSSSLTSRSRRACEARSSSRASCSG